MIAITDVKIEFFGKPTHAAASPWAGINALDAMVQLWNNISMLRQQLQPTDRVHGIVTDGGQAVCILLLNHNEKKKNTYTYIHIIIY